MRVVLALIILSISGCYNPSSDVISKPVGSSVIEKGRYLTHSLAHCGSCHGVVPKPGALLSGGQTLTDQFGEIKAPNLTSDATGLAGWSVPEIVAALRENKGKNERVLSPTAHRGYEWMSDEDATAIAAYIRSLHPVRNEIERRDLSFWERNTTGFFTKSKTVKGSVPSVPRRDSVGYSRYLTNHVATCGDCHSSAVSLLGSAEYMAGGKEFARNDEVKVAPSLLEVSGSWSEGEILQYLRYSKTPDGRKLDGVACPTAFYQRASSDDLKLIAGYIKGLVQ